MGIISWQAVFGSSASNTGYKMKVFLGALVVLVAANSMVEGGRGRERRRPLKQVEDVNSLNLELADAGSKLVVVEFVSSYCPVDQCDAIEPEVQALAKFYGDSVVFLQADAIIAADVVEAYGVSSFPAFLFFKNGNKIDQAVWMYVPQVQQLIDQHK